MPVTGRSLIEYFGPALRLEKKGCLPYNLHHGDHPLVFLLAKERRVVLNILNEILRGGPVFFSMLFKKSLEFRIFFKHVGKKNRFCMGTELIQMVVIDVYFF